MIETFRSSKTSNFGIKKKISSNLFQSNRVAINSDQQSDNGDRFQFLTQIPLSLFLYEFGRTSIIINRSSSFPVIVILNSSLIISLEMNFKETPINGKFLVEIDRNRWIVDPPLNRWKPAAKIATSHGRKTSCETFVNIPNMR